MTELRTFTHAAAVGRMVSTDDLRLQERLNGSPPRLCEMGEDCVMAAYGSGPQRLRRTNADRICSPCRREHRIPAIEKLKTNGHKRRYHHRKAMFTHEDLVEQAIRHRLELGYFPRHSDFEDPDRPSYLCSIRPVYRLFVSVPSLHAAARRALERRA